MMQIGNANYVPFQRRQQKDLLAFTGVPRRVPLDRGEMLCRFVTAENKKVGHYGNEIFRSPWWHTMASFMQIYNLAKDTRAPLDKAARARLAITEEFNPTMQFFCQIVIARPIYGWKGFARHQEDQRLNICYLGGAEQIYVPNLVAPHSDGMSSDYAFIRYFGPTDVLA